MAELRSIFPEKNIIQTAIGKIDYDYLVLATSTTSNFFGNKHIEEEAILMKSLSEAMGLRNALLSNLERSITCATEQERRDLLNIVIVGSGATEVEIVGAISEMSIMTCDANYPDGHPQLAQVAIQQGKLLAQNLIRLAHGNPMRPFRYKNLGTMATIGRNRAVAEIGRIKTQGIVAWFLWLTVHLRPILGVRNKINILLNWVWNYFSYDQSLRIILYAKKAKEVIEREKRESMTHWGDDLKKELDIRQGDTPEAKEKTKE